MKPIIAVMTILFLGCASARYTPVVFYFPSNLGETTCDQKDNPVIMVNRTLPPHEVFFVRLHEEEHVRQIHAFRGGCRAMMERLGVDPTFCLDIEAEAHCADFLARIRAGYNVEQMRVSLTEALQRVYAPKMSLEEVRTHIPC